MNIGIDCLEIKPDTPGGINTYLYGLLEGFKTLRGSNVHIIIFCTKENIHVFNSFNDEPNISTRLIAGYNRYLKYVFLILPLMINSQRLWRYVNNCYCNIFNVSKMIDQYCDVLYVPTTTLNSYNTKTPTVLSMHDIQHVHYPEYFSKLRLRVRNLNFHNSALTANTIQASSQFIKNDLLSYFKLLSQENISVIPEGVDIKIFENPDSGKIKEKFLLPDEYIFFPAQLWKHKNHLLVLKALKNIETYKNIIIPIVLTGGKYSAYDDVKRFISENNMDNVYYLGKVPWSDIVSLYKNAKLLITAASYESSSLPILEAAASGLPIIAASTPPNIEMSEFIEMNLFNLSEESSLTDRIYDCWIDLNLKSQAINNMLKVKEYSWINISKKYISLFSKILNHSNP